MEEIVKIKKIITTVDNDKSYSIDVDENTTFYEFKKILAGAAHLLKNSFRIFLDQQEYTNDYDDNTIQEMFPNIDPVPLHLFANKDIYEFEDELVSVRFNITVPCNDHIGKYKVLYCFSCNKSICMDCFNQGHKNHKVEEKADYLAPAQLLMNNIFSNSSLYKADSRLSKYMDCINFRSNLKLNIFDDLRKLINELEIKFASCLEYFSTCEDETEKNTNENLELLKKFCVECYIKLKNDINTKGIMIDDEIFLTLYYKLKEIERYKTERFEENKLKYEKLNTLLAPFIRQVETISNELKITFDDYLNKDIYDKFKLSIQENIVEKIQKEQVNDMMFKNLGVARKSLNRNSFGAISSYKKSGRSTNKSPNRALNEKNPFPKASYSSQQQGLNSGAMLGYDSSGNVNNLQQNYTSYTYSKKDEQKGEVGGFSVMRENQNFKVDDNSILNKKKVSTTTTTNFNNMNTYNAGGDRTNLEGKVKETINTNFSGLNSNIETNKISNIETTTISNVNTQGMKSILNNNIGTANLNMNMNSITESNINSNSNNIKTNNNFGNVGDTQNIQKETTVYTTKEISYPTRTTKFVQQEYNIQVGDSLPNINETQTQKNITKTVTTTTTISNNNLNGQNRGITSNMNINGIGTMNSNINSNIDKNYSQGGYEVTHYTTTTTNQHQMQNLGVQQGISTSNLINGPKLVDVLNNEINKNELELQEKMKNNNIIETHTEHVFGNNGTISQIVSKTQTIEYGNLYGTLPNSMFLFMYPIFNSNKIVGAVEDESTGKVEVDFNQAFGETDIQLNEFPQGGAFCNNGSFLYFTGGQEKQKGIGKIFLIVSILKTDYKAKLIKLPSMKYSHWNHSMIANNDYIFVIGGYNSNKCECFNLKTLKWELMPDLNIEERQRPILAIYKDYLYAFMGYTQYAILDSVERININKLGSSKWEKLSISNPEKNNLKFYGAGIYNYKGILYFVGGKIGQGNEEDDYKGEIYKFDFDKMEFSSTSIFYSGELNFIENEFHRCNNENIGNFIELNEGCLATIAISQLIK